VEFRLAAFLRPAAWMAKAKFTEVYIRLRRLLIQARQDAGIRQVDLAKRLGRPQSFVSKIESGERRLDVGEFVEVSGAIGADAPKLLSRAIGKK